MNSLARLGCFHRNYPLNTQVSLPRFILPQVTQSSTRHTTSSARTEEIDWHLPVTSGLNSTLRIVNSCTRRRPGNFTEFIHFIHSNVCRHILQITKMYCTLFWLISSQQTCYVLFHLPPTSGHLHPLQVENCDSNSWLVVDGDDNMVNSGLTGLMGRSIICTGDVRNSKREIGEYY